MLPPGIPPELASQMLNEAKNQMLGALREHGPTPLYRGSLRDIGYSDAEIDAIWQGVLGQAETITIEALAERSQAAAAPPKENL